MIWDTSYFIKYAISRGGKMNSLEVKAYAKEVSGSSNKEELTVTELRDFLNDLINAGYGDYSVEADTQDGESYSVRNEVLAFDLSKVVKVF